MEKYSFCKIEKKWQKFWEENKTFAVREDPSIPKEKRQYILDMFPYPSGSGLHVGHPEGYTATDIYSRYLRMNGYAVLHPMGFDSFGLPAENYAIKTGTHPRKTTDENITVFLRQIKAFGFSYDWSRCLATSDEEYFRWTQWIFLKLYEKGLAYESDSPINWCPSCLTGVANEEVENGLCERCGTAVERRAMRQWSLKITDYGDKLLEGLDSLDWPRSVKAQQTHWIGRSEGADVTFTVKPSDGQEEKLIVFTTRPDTLFGATYMVLAPEHPLVNKITTDDQRGEVEGYIKKAALKSDLERTELTKEKSGVFTGGYAINPINDEKIPIWIADYVLISYGTGAIMAVPAHDERDYAFATKFNLPIVEVVKGGNIDTEAYSGDGEHVNSGLIDGLNNGDAIKRIIEKLEAEGTGKRAVNFRLRDWVFSRQRYWGEPIPVVHCPECGVVPLKEKDLPLLLPPMEDYKPTDTGESPLARSREWLQVPCPRCGTESRRETNTMPQWAGSCWYYLRYLDPKNTECFVDPEKEKYWMPVNLYIGGAEHAVLHLLYARFWHMVLHEIGVVSTPEPFARLINQGMILGEIEFTGFKKDEKWISYEKVSLGERGIWRLKDSGKEVESVKLKEEECEKAKEGFVLAIDPDIRIRAQAEKMSKSRGNVINPDAMIEKYGADSLRIYEMFMGPLKVVKPWSTQGLAGVHRFLNRVWSVSGKEVTDDDLTTDELKLLHKTIKKVSIDTKDIEFNTAIAQMMVFINEVIGKEKISRNLWEPFVKMLSVYAPHIGEEMWEKLGHKETIAYENWPEWDEKHTIDAEKEIVFQINGKVRSKCILPAGLSKDELIECAKSDPKIIGFTEGRQIIKEVAVPDKLVNIVVK